MSEETQTVHWRHEDKVERVTLREVFGVEDGRFNWAQVAVLVVAFVIWQLVFSGALSRGLPDLLFWLLGTADALSILVLTVLLFRFISAVPLVLVLSAVIHAPFIPAYHHLFYGDARQIELEAIGLPGYLTLQALRWIVLLGVLGLALRLIKRPGVALLAGAILGGLAACAMIAFVVPFFWSHPEFGPPVYPWSSLAANFVGYASLGLLLWLGLIVTGIAPTELEITRPPRTRLLEARTDRPVFVWVLSIVLVGFAVGGPIAGFVTGEVAEGPPALWLVPLAMGVLGVSVWVGMPWVLVLLRVVWVLWCILVVVSALAASTIGGPGWSHALGLVCALLLIPIWFHSVKVFFSKTEEDLR